MGTKRRISCLLLGDAFLKRAIDIELEKVLSVIKEDRPRTNEEE